MRISYDDVKILITLVGRNRTIPSEIVNLFEKFLHSFFSFQRGKKHLYFDGVHVNVEVSFTFFSGEIVWSSFCRDDATLSRLNSSEKLLHNSELET